MRNLKCPLNYERSKKILKNKLTLEKMVKEPCTTKQGKQLFQKSKVYNPNNKVNKKQKVCYISVNSLEAIYRNYKHL